MINMYRVILFFILTQLTVVVQAQEFEFNPETKVAYDAIMALRINEGKELLNQERVRNPNNLAIDLIEDYADFFTILIEEKESDFRQLKNNRDIRLERLKTGPKDSPYYKYCQAEIYLHWALARSKFGEYFNAFLDIKKAFSLLKQNEKQFPDFVPNKKSLGLLHAMVGTIPESYRWGANVLGLNGTIEQGFQELNELIDYSHDHDYFFEDEALLFYTYLLLHLKLEDEAAWKIIENESISLENNLLNHFVVANIAMRTGHNDRAIDVLEQRPMSDVFVPFHYLDFMLGETKLYRGDADAAIYLDQFVTNFQGRHFIKDAYQKLAWAKLLSGDREGYMTNMNHCANQGMAVSDSDKKALKDSRSNILPNIDLLKARLQFDGGYYQEAKNHLSNFNESDFSESLERLEFIYRQARIEHALGNIDDAITYYQLTMQYQGENKTYFPANSSLMLGRIYEAQNDNEKATWYFKNCLSYQGHEYEDSIDQKAKAGLNRLRN